mmetsp:Transcript_12717/g.27852  ORF Transcript_12717/g.27852 Transcript_12717/m.27852 type:complete len:652 (+) Transcript_12717:232-2187(+)
MSAVRRGNAIATAADDDDSTSATTENKGSQQSTAKRRMLFKTAILPHAERKELHAEIYKYFQWLQHNLIEVQQQTSNNNKYTPLTKAGIIAPAIQQVLQGLESAFKGIEEDAPILARATKSNIQQEKVPFLESVLKDELSQLVKGNSVDSFEEMVDLLRQYKQQKGDVNVPKSYQSDFGSPLGQFVNNIRHRRRDIRSIHGLEFELQITSKYSLTKDRIQALDGMGFQWSTMESSSKQTFSWEERIQQLKEWRHTHGNLQIPRQEAQYGLGEFVSKCRRLYNKKDVTFMNTRAPTLESIGFEWKGIIQQKPKEAKAPLPFKTIVGSVTRGHPLPHHGVSYPPVPPRHQEQTTPNRTLQLVAPPSPPPQMAVVKPTATKRVIDLEPDFDTLFEQLLIYKKEHGDIYVAQKYKQNGVKLGKWAYKLRTRGKEKMLGNLTEDQVARLDRVGFEWKNRHTFTSWDDRYSELVEFYQNNGKWPPRAYKQAEEEAAGRGGLGDWVHVQRGKYRRKNEKFMKERVPRLEAIGFEWTPHKSNFETRFKELVKFKNEYGHARVPNNRNTYDALGKWCEVLRRARKRQLEKEQAGDDADGDGEGGNPVKKKGKKGGQSNNILTAERLMVLDSLGFDWEPCQKRDSVVQAARHKSESDSDKC